MNNDWTLSWWFNSIVLLATLALMYFTFATRQWILLPIQAAAVVVLIRVIRKGLRWRR